MLHLGSKNGFLKSGKKVLNPFLIFFRQKMPEKYNKTIYEVNF